MGIDLASGSQGWELVAESPSAISSGQPLRAEVRYSQLKPRAACPKGSKRPSGAFLELPDRGQNPPQDSPKARRWLLNALGPCLRPGIRHGADGVLESREGSLLGVTAMIGCCMAALCPAAAGSLVSCACTSNYALGATRHGGTGRNWRLPCYGSCTK
ncbi:hypothetical protein T069G_07564 [Trichoderma breve]|uniref:Uncharacterized protein n=1 Tax=Trichoderma breve TaxID=2034170 RepID=A0A9W9E7E5_9HYPO|nr:hypothetical protein T069G_07564 [Trichoderma breve]KAJ4859297.1 hypothetical protein T069G_07564 [Trichoderma breve]